MATLEAEAFRHQKGPNSIEDFLEAERDLFAKLPPFRALLLDKQNKSWISQLQVACPHWHSPLNSFLIQL